jgi:cytochrome c oxidase assembly factor CtaG
LNASVLAIGLWCSSSDRTWSWTPQPYLGAWVIVASVVGLSVWWAKRGSLADPLVAARALVPSTTPDKWTGRPTEPSEEGTHRTRTIAFTLGVLGLWACLDWPLATLGAGYLATAEMLRQIIFVMVVAPLLLFACPAPLAARLVGWGKRLTVLRWASRPIVAIPVAATSLVLVNAPAIVDPLLRTPGGAFAMDLGWVTAGLVLWMPVQCPHPGVRRLTGPGALTYLIAQSIVPVLPGFFMTWANFPIYATYELAPRAIAGFDAVLDQQTAAAVLQVGGMVLLWLQISYRFIHWAQLQMVDSHPIHPTIGATATSEP